MGHTITQKDTLHDYLVYNDAMSAKARMPAAVADAGGRRIRR